MKIKDKELLIKDYYIKKFISRLKLEAEIKKELEDQSLFIYEKIKILNLISDKNPKGIAGAIIYLSSMIIGNRISQRDIAKISGVTSYTIRNRYSEIIDIFNFFLKN
jgi:transcription initiation factor TFIIB